MEPLWDRFHSPVVAVSINSWMIFADAVYESVVWLMVDLLAVVVLVVVVVVVVMVGLISKAE